MAIAIYPKKICRILFIFVLVLLFANCVGILCRHLFPANHSLREISLLFDFNTESNVPTFFSSVDLLLAGILLFFIASAHKTNRVSCLPWYFLSAKFVFLSVDEIASLHERLMVPVSQVLHTSGIFFYSLLFYISNNLNFRTLASGRSRNQERGMRSILLQTLSVCRRILLFTDGKAADRLKVSGDEAVEILIKAGDDLSCS